MATIGGKVEYNETFDEKTKKEIGTGEFSKVYLMKSSILFNKYNAIKLLNATKSFENYLKNLKDCMNNFQIKGENIVNITSFFAWKDESDLYNIAIGMQYYKDSLKSELENRIKLKDKFSSEEIKNFTIQLLDIFQKLSFKRIFHKNLKPSNIFFTFDFKKIKISDFMVCILN